MSTFSRRHSKALGHAAVFTAYLIFGFNIIVCKGLTSEQTLSPGGIFLLRSLGAGAIFWVVSLFMPSERVARRDLPAIFMASFLGYFVTQLTFLVAIPLITPMESGLMSSLSPVYTMLIAAVAVREPVTWKKIAGVAVSLAGMLYLILTRGNADVASTSGSMLGILLMVGNALAFSLYLGIFRPVIERYSVVTFMKWIFLFAFLMALPVGAADIVRLDPSTLTPEWLAELAYLVVMATFVAYFLIPFGQKRIRPTLVSMYSYVQPIVAIAVSICLGMDTLTPVKVVAVMMVFGGVWIVSRSPSARSLKKTHGTDPMEG